MGTASQITDQDIDQMEPTVREYILLKEQQSRLAKREKELKAEIMEFLEQYGDPYGEEGQNRAMTLPSAIRGVTAVVRQRRVSTLVDETAAEAVARAHNLYERLFRPVMALDEGAVVVALEEGLLTDNDVERVFPKKVVHALVLEKGK